MSLFAFPSWPRVCPRCSQLIPHVRLDWRPSSRGRRFMHHQVDGAAIKPPELLRPKQTDGAVSGLKALRSRSSVLRQVADPGHASTRTILGQSAEVPIRARFAPSPTGYLHLGSLRTALFNNLAARASKGGAFILRIEDTDQSRLVQDAEERLLRDLRWAGLSWDEGPDRGGPYGPYRQSERTHIYAHHVRQLLDNGHAYRCFCSPEQVESQKRMLHEEGMPTAYAGTCRAIGPSESQRRAESGEPYGVRFKGDARHRISFRDAVYGLIQMKSTEEDFILVKSDGFPTYHFANVVDDHLMGITHVIRGEEWLISTPKHVALYLAFGWQPPIFAHLSLLVDANGAKLSKREDSVSLSKYQDDLVFPVALLSWLANLGSSFKPKAKTPRTVENMADALTFQFTRGGIKLNFAKLQHFQVSYRKALLSTPDSELSPAEADLIDRHLIQPLLREIDVITEGSNSNSNSNSSSSSSSNNNCSSNNKNNNNKVTAQKLPPAWQTPLDLVPALRSASSRASYVNRIFAATQDRFDCPTRLAQQHPYLFWRVPPSLYLASGATASALDRGILAQLRRAVEESWHDDEPPCLLDGVRRHFCLADSVPIHQVLRLVGAGDRHVVSHSSACMLALLGRDEWRYRFRAISDAWSTVPLRQDHHPSPELATLLPTVTSPLYHLLPPPPSLRSRKRAFTR
ncbi:hypothetical protein XA68_14931 [Ophiocordyceps unilateralis]|uniref:Glutamate--tRNA ligase, mitochondrial n=1 Tax=Ophiocordyceps unilateralis TaxID=268505 RepID=A0A2A9PPK1_OPHUN|nr:hypothetical protein XA68_14931 [Ophiocordyceps unilateralis]